MRALIVYESMFGNTHEIAEHIAAGLRPSLEVTVDSVDEATKAAIADVELLVVGGPTHVHGMTSSFSRRSAAEQAEADEDLELDPAADNEGLRDWLKALPKRQDRPAAAFDTRMDASAAVTGRASKRIARQLKHHGCELIAEPESFLVDKENHLLDDELSRAQEWGESLAARFAKLS